MMRKDQMQLELRGQLYYEYFEVFIIYLFKYTGFWQGILKQVKCHLNNKKLNKKITHTHENKNY